MEIQIPKCAVFLIGLPGSGKTTAASYLTNLGFRTISAGDLIRRICQQEGRSPTRENLSLYGQNLLNLHGTGHFVDLLLKEANESTKVVFEGIRPVEVLSSLKQRIQHTMTILVEASEDKRLERLMVARGEDEDSYRRVMQASMEHEIINAEYLIDERIENNGDIAKFYRDLRRVINSLPSDC
jgi:dephospho-CoA kinase